MSLTAYISNGREPGYFFWPIRPDRHPFAAQACDTRARALNKQVALDIAGCAAAFVANVIENLLLLLREFHAFLLRASHKRATASSAVSPPH